jgi:predicted N-acetyltransferase YhbS
LALKRQSLRGKLSAGTELHATTAAADVPDDMALASIRPAAEHDIIEMITLLAQAGRPMPTPGQFTAVAAVFREMMGHESALALVAEKKGQVVGVLLGALRPRANWLTPELWIADTAQANDEDAAVGRSLLIEALAVAQRWGCFRVVCEATNGVSLTPGLLSDFGFVESGPAYSLPLAPMPTVGTRGVQGAENAHEGVPITYRETSV